MNQPTHAERLIKYQPLLAPQIQLLPINNVHIYKLRLLTYLLNAFSALTLLVGRQEEHMPSGL